jgi:hypothetical protein
MNNDQLYFYNRGFNDCLAKGLNLAKTLTDDEIKSIWSKTVCSVHMTNAELQFAKEIIKKAQEK